MTDDLQTWPDRQWPLVANRVVDIPFELFLVHGFEPVPLLKLDIGCSDIMPSMSLPQGCDHGIFLNCRGALLDTPSFEAVTVMMGSRFFYEI